uniref:NADH-ubiquinone oxidoreductase chain 4 n=1 Tax=Tridacna squamosa TaxID=80830 RepID=A0A0U1Z170_TRISQ|nr:NADH dehydrogenase subunit 4 [Tridacna squamosa]AJK90891.1 NADH dehydrogenase subunit 4 [Tridacna squamosa]
MLMVLAGFMLMACDYHSFSLLFSLLLVVSASMMCGWGGQCYELLSRWAGVDQLSKSLVFLVVIVSVMAYYSASEEEVLGLGMMVVVSGIIAVLIFICARLFPFFFMFEASLIPMFGMIVGWGYQPERSQAAISMMIYTSAGSLPMFLFISWVDKTLESDSIILLSLSMDGVSLTWFLWLAGILAFLIKMPLFGLHGWLPKAHVEAPVSGSVILAGIMLKFGGYGLMRFMWVFKWESCSALSDLLLIGALWGGFVSTWLCVVQADMKSLIAYSSISHMSLVMAGILSCTSMGWSAALVLMFSHGLSSPILFMAANYSYEVYQSRSMVLCKGLLKLQPMLVVVWFGGVAMSVGFPPSSAFFAEVGLISSGFMQSASAGLVMGLMCFMSFGYSFFLFMSVTHGGVSKLMKTSAEEKSFGYLILISAVALIMLMGMCMDLFFLG